jgi:hypothetical protein
MPVSSSNHFADIRELFVLNLRLTSGASAPEMRHCQILTQWYMIGNAIAAVFCCHVSVALCLTAAERHDDLHMQESYVRGLMSSTALVQFWSWQQADVNKSGGVLEVVDFSQCVRFPNSTLASCIREIRQEQDDAILRWKVRPSLWLLFSRA